MAKAIALAGSARSEKALGRSRGQRVPGGQRPGHPLEPRDRGSVDAEQRRELDLADAARPPPLSRRRTVEPLEEIGIARERADQMLDSRGRITSSGRATFGAIAEGGRGWWIALLACPTARAPRHAPARRRRPANTAARGEIGSKGFDNWPDANVGIATGAESGLVVLDVDPRHGGDESLEELETRYGRLPLSPVVLTGGGGTHSYFAHPKSAALPNRSNLGGFAGIDFKADGGYVVAPPSRHASGRAYEWSTLLHSHAVPLPPCPDYLLELAAQGPSAKREHYAPTEWDGSLPSRAARLIRTRREVRERFRRVPGGHADRTPSGVDASLASMLPRHGLPGPDVEATVRASRARAGLPRRPDSYFASTVGKALGWSR
jgi:hypothetical protein